ncbi:uncharacterized protein LOC124461839 [Drosophila willistoni]|uniref:uncharacterized protein LOC124461839 n=1 Tax=Drosophila willistoni TaxID=7260 RepID=UPI001F07B988|nr:uncharacterized protein LOC124461839 [Drosophila willistoni]
MTPVDLLAHEAERIYATKMESAPSPAELKGVKAAARQWTFRLIPDLKMWFNRKHGEVTFELTQILSGHGCFGEYLYRFGHQASAECTWCWNERQEAELLCGEPLSSQNLVPLMTLNQRNWTAICTFAAQVICKLRAP